MKLFISISALALAAALSTSAQAGCTGNDCSGGKGNVANIKIVGRNAITNLTQDTFDTNHNDIKVDAALSKLFVGMKGANNNSTMKLNAGDNTLYFGGKAGHVTDVNLLQNGGDATLKTGKLTAVVSVHSGDKTTVNAKFLNAEQGANIIALTTDFNGKNTVNYTVSPLAYIEGYVGMRSDGLGILNADITAPSGADFTAEQQKRPSPFDNPMLVQYADPTTHK